MKIFQLDTDKVPSEHQQKAIDSLTKGLNEKEKHQVLLGITGSGKTFIMANIIKNINRPVVILSHNKTLAAQLYAEFKSFFPTNAVEYFVSYFDYYRPEAYMPNTDTYIDKTSKSNWDLEAMRMSTINSLLTRKDTIVVSSVAAIYGALNPKEYSTMFLPIHVGQTISRKEFLYGLVKRNYSRNDIDLAPSTFRVRGDVIDISPGWTSEFTIRIEMFGDEIEGIKLFDSLTGEVFKKPKNLTIFPGQAYSTQEQTIKRAIEQIKVELKKRLKEFKEIGKLLEAQRLEERTNHDLEALEEFGVCPGIENYSMHLDGRSPGEMPYTLFDYLPSDAFIFVDESHMMLPQIKGMYRGDRSRKETLVNFGFRLPTALDNRPLRFDEWEDKRFQKVYVSATPAEYEIDQANGVVSEVITRPTGLLDPTIEIVPSKNQIEDIVDRIKKIVKNGNRLFVLTVTIRMSEELTRYLQEKGIKVSYLHNELKTLERTEILRKLRLGVIDVVVGINLIREGIDIPEVSEILVLDADKESFFRSKTSLMQIVGRAARNKNGNVVFYADKMTDSMSHVISITEDRRKFQIEYNKKNNITPKTVKKAIPPSLMVGELDGAINAVIQKSNYSSKKQKQEMIQDLRTQMLKASKELNFERAAQLRDLILELES
ncbi:MAG: excinuclease ABC subunit UvrB [Mycoplasma sp.]|nr:excinuclease ABC subunit UvrB [Mycoplasma sp.]